MKRILYILFLCFVSFFLKAQNPYTGLTGYSIKQSLGSDSAIVQVKGALSGRMVIYNFADTTTANTQRIKNYPGALIFTTDSSRLWLRNKFASAWGSVASSSGTTIVSIDIFSDSSWVICYSDGSCDTIDVNNDVFVTINNVFGGCNNLLAGGVVTANDPGNTLVFDVTSADYTINCKAYHTDDDQVTLADGHVTFDRFDVIIVDTNEVVSVLQGTPSADPQVPQIDHASQLVLTTFLVPAGATTADDLGIEKKTIYDENLQVAGGEWDSSGVDWTRDFANTSFPAHLTKDLLLSGTTTSTSQIKWTTTDTMRNGQFDVLKFYIRLTDAWVLGQGLDISFYRGTTKVSNSIIFSNNSYGFDQTVTAQYQIISIPMAQWVLTDSIFFSIVFKPLATPFSSQAFRLDWIQLQGGINQLIGGSSGLYIWNQFSVDQPANYRIAGAALIKGGISSTNPSYYLSERYGLNAIANGIAATAVGSYATVTGNNGTAIGDESHSTGGIALGYFTRAGGSTNISIGGTTEAATSSILLGKDGTVSGNQSMGFGQNATVSHNNSIVFGYFGASTAANQFVVGSDLGSNFINNFYLGNVGVSGTNASDVTWRISGESGTNQSGHTLNIGSGAGTGNASTGSIIDFQTSDATASGTGAQSLSTKFRILQSGQLRALPYGDGTFSGTPTYVAAFDTDGNIIEWPPGGIGGGILTDADNGLSLRSSTIAVLGNDVGATDAVLISNREIPMANFTINIKADAAQTNNLFAFKNTGGNVRARITSAAEFSNNNGSTGSEQFGEGALASGNNSTAFGYGAVAAGQSNIAIGNGAVAHNSNDNTIIGHDASNVSSGTTIVGASSDATSGGRHTLVGTAIQSSSASSVGVGYGISLAGGNNVAIGEQANAGHTYSQAYGFGATTTAGNQLVYGASNSIFGGVDDAYYGRGVTSTVANDFKMQPTGASGTDMAGNQFRLAGSKATGNAIAGNIIFQTSVLGSTGTTLQTLGDRYNIVGKYTTLTEATATAFARVNVPTGTVAGGEVIVTIEANDATDFQARTLTFAWTAANKAGTTDVDISTPVEVVSISSGTLTVTITIVDSGSGNVDFKADATSSLTQTVLRANCHVFKNFGTGSISSQ